MIIISDMGDALSINIPFAYLIQEIIDVVDSEAGRSHIWLWLSKRPVRMVEFGQWLPTKGLFKTRLICPPFFPRTTRCKSRLLSPLIG